MNRVEWIVVHDMDAVKCTICKQSYTTEAISFSQNTVSWYIKPTPLAYRWEHNIIGDLIRHKAIFNSCALPLENVVHKKIK